MKYLVLIPMLFLAACEGDQSFTTTGAGASISVDGSSATSSNSETVPAPAPVGVSSSGRCSPDSRAEGIC